MKTAYVWPIRNVSNLYGLIKENISEKIDYQILTWMKENLDGKDQIVSGPQMISLE